MSRRTDEFDDNWSDYKKRDTRKRNHGHDRTVREFKHHYEPEQIENAPYQLCDDEYNAI